MKKTFTAILLVCLCLQAIAQESQTVFNFLRIPTSAHGAALGGDNISVIEDDASLALSNPALLSSVSHRTISLGYMNYMSGTGMFTGGYTHILNEKATIGGAAHYVNYGSMVERDHNGAEIGSFRPSDVAIEALFSYTLYDNIVGGIGAKFVYSKIGRFNSTAAAVDLGVNYYHPELDLSVSLAMKNLGGQLSAYEEEFESMPFDISVGATYRLMHTPFRFSLTFSDLNHWDYSFLRHACIGLDIIICKQVYIAGGYNLRRQHEMKVTALSDGSESSHGAGLSVGAGLMLDHFKLNISYEKYHVSSSSLMFNAAYSL